jgi:DMSO/TMAO reductase YedYZ molybdopterin-dependent catalytic subunit
MRATTWRGGVWTAAGLLWLAAAYAVAPLTGGFLLEPVVRVVVRSTPGPVATAAIETFGKSAQPLLAVGVGLGAVAVLAVAGAAWPAVARRLPVRPRSTRWVGLSVLALGVLVLLAVDGALVPVSALAGVATVVPPALLLSAADRATRGGGTDLARRGVLSRTALGAVAVAGLGGGSRALSGLVGADEPPRGSGQPLDQKRAVGRTVTDSEGSPEATSTSAPDADTDTPAGTPLEETTTAASATTVATDAGSTPSTPEDDPFGFDFGSMPRRVGGIGTHYVVDINREDPRVDADDWRLEVTGHVDAPYALTHDELLASEAAVTRPVTMVCISNQVGGDLISTTTWTGVPLAALLERAGVRDGAVDVVTHAVDGYSEAIPLSVAREERVMLAFGADGRTLTPAHGFPARLLIPGRYGMKSTKWVTEIELSTSEHDAYWEARGWDEEAVVNTLSYIRSIERREGMTAVGGVAYAGVRGIQAVEVSVDGGETWAEAELEEAPSEYAWRRWRYVFERDFSKSYTAAVRAIDGTGEVQTGSRSPPHPGGSTGWHHRDL